MKLTKVLTALAAAAMIAVPLTAENGWNFGVSVDMAEYPDFTEVEVPAYGFVYAPISGAYNGLEGRVNLTANYTIATPLGDNWLVSGANVVLGGKAEITPVSINLCSSATFTPVPFLVFSAGAQIGEGWDIGDVFTCGMSKYNTSTYEYESLTGQSFFYKGWAQATFQFDVGALVPGDWTHVQMMASYQAYYESLFGLNPGDIWAWNCSGNRLVAPKEYTNIILAYAMPAVPVLSRVGVVVETDRYYYCPGYNGASVALDEDLYKCTMPEINVSPMAQLTITPKDSMTVLFNFCFKRGYDSNSQNAKNDDGDHYSYPESMLVTTGYLGYFKRIAIQYSHQI